MANDDVLLAYFGHHKCATQWMKGMVGELCKLVGREHVVFSGARRFDHDVRAALQTPGTTFLSYLNAERAYVDPLGPLRGFHVVRDPRDVVVSAYFSHLHSHPTGNYPGLEEYRTKLQELSEEEGILLELERRRHQFDAMASWDYQRPDVLELRMEDLTANASRVMPEVVAFLGLGADDGITDKRLAHIVSARDFKNLAGRAPGEEDVTSHFRKGTPGDWRNHFTAEHTAYFKEHYNDLLLLLGYEASPDWG
jgi:hypothetical protein